MKTRRTWSDFSADPAVAAQEPLPRTDTKSRVSTAFAREVVARTVRPDTRLFRLEHKGYAYPLHPAEVDYALGQGWSLMAQLRREIVPIDADTLSTDQMRDLCGLLPRGFCYPSGGFRASINGKWWPLPHRRYITLAGEMGIEVVRGYHLLAIVRDDEERAAVVEIAKASGADVRVGQMLRIAALTYPTVHVDLERDPQHELERAIQEDLRRRLSSQGVSRSVFDSADLANALRAWWTASRQTELLETFRVVEPMSEGCLYSPEPTGSWVSPLDLPKTASWRQDDRRWPALLEWYQARGAADTVAEIETRRAEAPLPPRQEFENKHRVMVDVARAFVGRCKAGDREEASALAEECALSVKKVALLTSKREEKVRDLVGKAFSVPADSAEDELHRVAWSGVSESSFELLPRLRWSDEKLDRVRDLDTAGVVRLLDDLPRPARRHHRRKNVTEEKRNERGARNTSVVEGRVQRHDVSDGPPGDLGSAIRGIEARLLKRGYDPLEDRSPAAWLTLGELRRRGYVDPDVIWSWVEENGAQSAFLAAYCTERTTGEPFKNPRRGRQRFLKDWTNQEKKGRWWKHAARSRQVVEEAVTDEQVLGGRKRRCLTAAYNALAPYLDARPTLALSLHVLVVLCGFKGRPAPGHRELQRRVGCGSHSTVGIGIADLIGLGCMAKADPIRKGYPDLRAQEFEILVPSEDEIVAALLRLYPELHDVSAPRRKRLLDLPHFDWLDPALVIAHAECPFPCVKGASHAQTLGIASRAPPGFDGGAQGRFTEEDAGRLMEEVRAMNDFMLPTGFLVRAAAAARGCAQSQVLAELARGSLKTQELAQMVGDSRLVAKAWSIATADQHYVDRSRSRREVRKLAMELGASEDSKEREQADDLRKMIDELGEPKKQFSDDLVEGARRMLAVHQNEDWPGAREDAA